MKRFNGLSFQVFWLALIMIVAVRIWGDLGGILAQPKLGHLSPSRFIGRIFQT